VEFFLSPNGLLAFQTGKRAPRRRRSKVSAIKNVSEGASQKEAPSPPPSSSNRVSAALIIGALGVVYGDIGTSPLYALRECFAPAHGLPASHENVLGVLSLIFWSLLLIVSLKYLMFVMRADNRGEGGILALMSLAFPDRRARGHRRLPALLVTLGVFGAALLYGDGMITPSISVLSAIEGLEVATPAFRPFIVPVTAIILVLLFSFQKHGTGAVGKIFGPIMLIWFFVIGALGVGQVWHHPEVLGAMNPWHALQFFQQNGGRGFVVLGTVFLVLTGTEALYADMGHFGRIPIRATWFSIVLPGLFLNYLGQGALLLADPTAAANPFYLLAPKWALYPVVALATVAAVIASQALISGAFSLTMQAIQLGYWPRLEIDHTSVEEKGQIYIAPVNWILMFSCIALVIGFKSSSRLAAAYGIAVSLTMLITTVLFYFAARRLWAWNPWLCAPICVVFFGIECAFLGANLLKFAHGGWFPLVVGAAIYTLMSTWKRGRRLLSDRLRASVLPYAMFLEDVGRNPPLRVSGTAVYLSGSSEGTPMALLHNLKHNKVLHERTVILTIVTDEIPHVEHANRVEVEDLKDGFYRVVGHYGFMEDPNVPDLMRNCGAHGLEFKEHETTFFLSRETIIATNRPGMALWREHLFALMSRNAQRATAFFRLPPNRVVELGMQVEI
jgi:KUP system potassium uptake protein